MMMKPSVVLLLLAFVACCFASSPKRLAMSKENKEIRNKIMNFNYDVEEFLDKIQYDKKVLIEGQHKSVAKSASKFFNCILREDGLLDSVRNVLSKTYKMIIKKELKTSSHKKFCQKGGLALNVVQKLQKCINRTRLLFEPKKESQFLEDLYLVINGTAEEICKPNNLEYKLAVLERFREEINSDQFKSAFKRYEELQNDCTKLKTEDYCLPLVLADAFDTEAIESQVFTEKSRGIFKTLMHIYFTIAIKAPYKNISQCPPKIEN